MPVSWPDHVDEILGADLTAALGYVTPAGGAVVMAVAPIGLRDRERGTVGFTTSLGFAKKLDRIRREPRVALAYHAREHGARSRSEYVLVQGRAEPVEKPTAEDRALVRRQAEQLPGRGPQRAVLGPLAARVLHGAHPGLGARGAAHRLARPALRTGEPERYGLPEPAPRRSRSRRRRKGTGPRVDMERVAKRLAKTPHLLLGHVGSDGYPDGRPGRAARPRTRPASS